MVPRLASGIAIVTPPGESGSVRDFELTTENLLALVRGELVQPPRLRVELCDRNGSILAEYECPLTPTGTGAAVQARPNLDPLIDSRAGDLIESPFNALLARARLVIP